VKNAGRPVPGKHNKKIGKQHPYRGNKLPPGRTLKGETCLGAFLWIDIDKVSEVKER